MKEASKPFAWWLIEMIFGGDVKMPMTGVKDSLPTFTAVKAEGQTAVEEKEEPWHLDIRG